MKLYKLCKSMLKSKFIKEKFTAITGSISGFTSFLGSYQVCHNLCLGLVALLSVIGITVVGMPLLFLTKVSIYLWTAAVILLLLTIWLYVQRKAVSNKLIILNTGFIIAGIPFQSFQKYSIVLWSLGGALILLTIIIYFNDTFLRGKRHEKKT